MKFGQKKKRNTRFALIVFIPLLCALFLLMCGRETGEIGESAAPEAQRDTAVAETDQGGGAGDTESGVQSAGSGEGTDLPFIQQIAFTAGRDHSLQRSLPVQIDASILGGTQGEMVWSIFLPSEMADSATIVCPNGKEAAMTPLGEGGAAGDETVYASGDEVKGLTNGSRFNLRILEDDQVIEETEVHVFSCTGMASMYLDTESGSMENVDSDESAETTESAFWLVVREDGEIDSAGNCVIKGRGNSTWTRKKRPYNVTLTKQQSVLGMKECKKLALLANSFDDSNLLNRIASRMAISLGMRDTPEGEFVNLYLNGQYNGLYYLTQRVRTGGSVNIKKLNNKILEANGLTEEPAELPERIRLDEDGEKPEKWAFDWEREPKEITGGYLLEHREGYSGEDAWFSTDHRRFRIISPSYPTKAEVTWLQDYMMAAERALYSEDGIDPETGKHYSAWLDLPSWQDMFLLEEYFGEWDGERWSFFITKDRNDPLLYCGPMWDFDHSAGEMLHGTYPETAVSMLMFRDNRRGWLHQLLSHKEFTQALHTRWVDRFSPAVRTWLDEELDKEISAISSAAYMNNIRRLNDFDYLEKAEKVKTWLYRRADFLDGYCSHTVDYCRVVFQFSWGDLSHYVPRGETLGYLPLSEYGEYQTPSQIEKNEIFGWQDENGQEISADIVINEDRVFTPVY